LGHPRILSPRSFVIPAEAGIVGGGYRARVLSPTTPAFAGVTRGRISLIYDILPLSSFYDIMHVLLIGDIRMPPFQPLPIQTPDQLAVHIKSLRKLLGLTQAQLGERLGVKQARVADIERNPGSVSVDQLLQVLHALDARLLLADAHRYAPQEPAADW
jgi:HTH-type transcriptional regulator/antitoxin HipB